MLGKLLPSITVPAPGWYLLCNAGYAVLNPAEHASVLELLAALKAALVALVPTADITVSADGYVTITCASAVNWAGSTTGLLTELGYAGTETGPDYVSTLRHLHGWYSPVGVDYPPDERKISARYEDRDDGGLDQYASAAVHRWRTLRYGLLSLPQVEDGGMDGDGSGGTCDWTSRTLYDFWAYTRDRPFRQYLDRTYGTVSAPSGYNLLRRSEEDWAPTQRDPSDWAYIDVEFKVKVVTS